ncbi:response regulator [Labrys monachus]|uniref:Two-component system response regulator FixJ n=1 Tax=Labrys monachus TaxID=217067 RepID=A0ABU0F8Y7_9HYPH|nr:response regulator [Labrys monachus]MDQ0391073.1 two-component system response regulator FixJ [Labrys monachus]
MNTRVVHVIDDDDAVRDSLAFLLGTAGFEVKTYESGQGFLDLREEALEGCVVTDVRMPGLSGFELAVRLRARGSRLPLIVITGEADMPLAIEAMKAGAVDFLEKPFDDGRMIRAIENAISADGEPSGEEGPFDIVARRLAMLSEHERRVLDDLIDGVAGSAAAAEPGAGAQAVQADRDSLVTKMQAGTTADLVRLALVTRRSRKSLR